MFSPRVAHRDAINQVSVELGRIEQRISRYKLAISLVDKDIRENVEIAAEVARCQLAVVDDFLRPQTQRNYALVPSMLEEKLNRLREDCFENYRSFVGARGGFDQKGNAIKLTPQKIQEMVGIFSEQMNANIAQHLQGFKIEEGVNLEQLKQHLEDKIEKETERCRQLEDEKEQKTMEMYALEEEVDPTYKALLIEKKRLAGQLQREVKDIFSACQEGALDFFNSPQIQKDYYKQTPINEPNEQGFRPLDIAANANQPLVVDLLLKNGADPKLPALHDYQPLHWASKKGFYQCVALLLTHGAPVNGEAEYKRTPLHMAAYNSRLETAKLLLEKGANINAQEDKGNKSTPIHDATIHKDVEMVRCLVAHPELNVNLKNALGWTPLSIAVQKGNLEIAKLIASHPSWVAPSDEEKENPNTLDNLLKITRDKNSEEIQNFLKIKRVENGMKEAGFPSEEIENTLTELNLSLSAHVLPAEANIASGLITE